MVADRKAAGGVLESRRAEVHVRMYMAVVRVPVVRGDGYVGGPSLIGGDPAVGGAAIVKVLVVKHDSRPSAWSNVSAGAIP